MVLGLLLLTSALACACVGSASGEATPFLSCTEKNDPISVHVKGCSHMPCRLPKGEVASMAVDFEVDQDVEQLDVTVTAFALGAQIDFPLKQKNACKSLTNAECPLDKYEQITYQLALDVDKSYPSISLAVEVSLRDKSKRLFTCFRLNLQVVDPE